MSSLGSALGSTVATNPPTSAHPRFGPEWPRMNSFFNPTTMIANHNESKFGVTMNNMNNSCEAEVREDYKPNMEPLAWPGLDLANTAHHESNDLMMLIPDEQDL